jgi:hypothetical protein
MKPFMPAILLALVLAMTLPAIAQISPGKLSRYHEKLEGIANCTRCHALGKEVSNEKCVECHTAIGKETAAQSGYHGSSEVRDAKCKSCHSEHAGLEFEPVHWVSGKEGFNHSLTGFALEGGHHGKQCSDCHRSDYVVAEGVKADANVNVSRTYLGLSTRCTSCHADEHAGQVKGDCQTCHNFDAWKPAPGFSHAMTQYPLTGKHEQVDCDKCHPWQTVTSVAANRVQKKERVGTYAKYADLTYPNCIPCHRDKHEGKFGTNCEACHVTTAFQSIVGNTFDHSKTKYPLEGKHKYVACRQCHTSGDMTVHLAFAACSDCHKDEHRGQFAARPDKGACDGCHTLDGYTPSKFGVAEHAQSKYPLTGSHLAIACVSCHGKPKDQDYAQFKYADTTCKTCHADPHQGQLDLWIAKGGCEYCHNTDTWHRTTFDHKQSRFALDGKHREIVCLKCHKVVNPGTPNETVWIKPLSMECAACHNDIHNGQFLRADLGEKQTDCKRCHTADAWKQTKFDHNRDSRFTLSGAHAKTACAGCHKISGASTDGYVVYKPLKTDCVACHASGNLKL